MTQTQPLPLRIGQHVLRSEDARLVTGRGCFVDDLVLPGCLHLEFLRSTHARGNLTHVETRAALAQPHVVACIVGADLDLDGGAEVNRLVPEIAIPSFSALALDHVFAVGQPIAAVVAASALAARDACELIVAEIEPDASVDPRGSPAFQQRWTTNDVDPLFARAAHVVSVTIDHARLAPMALEPRAAAAVWDAATGGLTVWLSTQTPHRARADLARLLRMDIKAVRVIAPDVGGAFGGKASIYPEEIIVAWAALKLRRAVRWCASRSDEMAAAAHGRGGSSRGDLALDADGRALALRARFDFPLGHWMTYSSVVPAFNAGRILPGPYAISAVDIQAQGTSSHTAAVGIYRGAGRPEAAILLERLMDRAAEALGLDAMEIRRRNVLPKISAPHLTPTSQRLDACDLPGLLQRAGELVMYADRRSAQVLQRRAGAVVGIGIGLYVEPCGQGWESATVELRGDGYVVAAIGTTAQGQGRETASRQIVCDVLGLDAAAVEIRHGDTATTPNGIGALASRGTPIGGSALLEASRKFLAQAKVAAAAVLSTDVDGLVSDTAGFAVTADPSRHVTWAELAQRHAARGTALRAEVVYQAPGEAWASGCCIAEVSINADTGVPTVTRIVWVDDAGVVVNPMLVDGQLLGGLAQGLGEALMERIVYDTDGQLITGSLLDYAVPRAGDMPPVILETHPTPSLFNALGAKGVGEAGCIGVPAAIVNAVVDALKPFGVRHLDMPLTAPKIWHAMQAGLMEIKT